MPLQITGDVPVVGIVREVGESWRQFREIEGVIASIELENVQSGNSKLFMHVADDGKYALVPIECKVIGYVPVVPSERDTFRLTEEKEGHPGFVTLTRKDLFTKTEVKLYFETPEYMRGKIK
ncbi:MAG TPA: hypothetical protein VJJ52_04685 [Candidatus Nanoarchaeia archaeon]|nr:hypothetical protein [Candidatus Nanoarchaeia archaeon]